MGERIAKVDRRAVGSLDSARRKIVADEQLVDDELDFLGVQIDVAAHQRSKPR